jgi:putative RNA 2'-phosphotransferase
MPNLLPKTLAKTLAYIGYHAPGEYGLFWDEDGTMPWKEFYWALQQDPELRFVREASMRELGYLGCDLPFALEDNRLRIRNGVALPEYPLVVPPEKLYYGCPLRSLAHLREHGLVASHRNYIPLAINRPFAEAMAKRRDPAPLMIEVLGKKASQEDIVFRSGGADLYLVSALPSQYLVFPILSAERLAEFGRGRAKESNKRIAEPFAPAGSFLVKPEHLQEVGQKKETSGKGGKKGARGSDWKREGRKLRGKRTV